MRAGARCSARTLGGLLVEHLGWRWIFLVNVPIGIVAVVPRCELPPAGRARDAGRLDVARPRAPRDRARRRHLRPRRERAAPAASLGRVLLPAARPASRSSSAFVCRALRIAAAAARRAAVREPRFAAASVTTFCLGAALFGAMILMPLYFQNVHGEDAVDDGAAAHAAGHRRGLRDAGLGALDRSLRRRPARPRRRPRHRARRRCRSCSSRRHAVVADRASLLVSRLRDRDRDHAGDEPPPTPSCAPSRSPTRRRSSPSLQRVGGSIGTAVLAVVTGRKPAPRHDALRTRPPRLPVRTGGRSRSPCSPWFRRRYSCRRSAGPEEASTAQSALAAAEAALEAVSSAPAPATDRELTLEELRLAAPPHARRPSAAQKP